MLQLVERIDRTTIDDTKGANDIEIFDTLTLPYELRIRGRLKATTDNKREVGLFLDRGPVMRHKDLLKASTGEIVQVLAADEPVATAYIGGSLPLARLAYHLGNRHVSLAIGSDSDGRHWVRFPPDHVLEELARLLGAEVMHHDAPFDPESGAYAHAGREHVQNHGYAHEHEHEDHHEREHNHGHGQEHSSHSLNQNNNHSHSHGHHHEH